MNSVLDTPLPLDGCVQRPMHKDVGYCQEVTTIMADALDEIYTYKAQCLECFFHVNWTKYADLVGMNVSSDVYSMRIYCCQHKKQMGETTAEPRAKTFTCSHCIRVCGSMIGLYSQSRRCSNRDWHTMGAQPIVSRDRRRSTTTTIFITSISCFVCCILDILADIIIVEILAIVIDTRQQIANLNYLYIIYWMLPVCKYIYMLYVEW